jgi:hypothetical protein
VRLFPKRKQHERAAVVVEYLLLVGLVVGIALTANLQRTKFETQTAAMMVRALGGGSEGSGVVTGPKRCHIPQSDGYTCKPDTCFFPVGDPNYRCEYCASPAAGSYCKNCRYDVIKGTLSCGRMRSGP